MSGMLANDYSFRTSFNFERTKNSRVQSQVIEVDGNGFVMDFLARNLSGQS
jgi:hypothetical protein